MMLMIMMMISVMIIRTMFNLDNIIDKNDNINNRSNNINDK